MHSFSCPCISTLVSLAFHTSAISTLHSFCCSGPSNYVYACDGPSNFWGLTGSSNPLGSMSLSATKQGSECGHLSLSHTVGDYSLFEQPRLDIPHSCRLLHNPGHTKPWQSVVRVDMSLGEANGHMANCTFSNPSQHSSLSCTSQSPTT